MNNLYDTPLINIIAMGGAALLVQGYLSVNPINAVAYIIFRDSMEKIFLEHYDTSNFLDRVVITYVPTVFAAGCLFFVGCVVRPVTLPELVTILALAQIIKNPSWVINRSAF